MYFQLDIQNLQVNLFSQCITIINKVFIIITTLIWQKLVADVTELFHVYIHRCLTFPHQFQTMKT